MGVGILFIRVHLCEGPLRSLRDEDGIIPESVGPALFPGDGPLRFSLEVVIPAISVEQEGRPEGCLTVISFPEKAEDPPVPDGIEDELGIDAREVLQRFDEYP